MFGRCSKIFLCCVLATLVIDGFPRKLSKSDKTKRIIGGTPININERPYIVQIRTIYDGECFCGGTLVDSTHVVTAADCLDLYDPIKDLVVVGGASTKAEEGVKRKIIASYVHPQYSEKGAFDNDAAVLKLELPMEGENIRTMVMSFDDVENGQFLTVSGWGLTEVGELGPDELLRTVRVEKISNDTCRTKMHITSSMMCAASPHKDACRGDSGGPVIYHDKLVAIVSWGIDCAHHAYPGVYTSLKVVKEFLLQSLSK